ncbi:hypothetical protein [Isoptericola croceus]|uniref:hypothetical protein n=1 Tax=Isoptericola croceus TaxID=3031406 RepID=UPI0023F9AF31|nr:hypothetical protein [Isoptericola croceus]
MTQIVRAGCPCSWHGQYASQALADAALRRHSCERWQAKADAARRRRTSSSAVDRTPKTCAHDGAHTHGTYAMYQLDNCRCQPCAQARSAYNRVRAIDQANGRTAYVDARPAVTHVRRLMAAGLGWKRGRRPRRRVPLDPVPAAVRTPRPRRRRAAHPGPRPHGPRTAGRADATTGRPGTRGEHRRDRDKAQGPGVAGVRMVGRPDRCPSRS